MTTPSMLWNQYHQAVKNKDQELARAILKKIHNFKNYPTSGGCSSCNRKLF